MSSTPPPPSLLNQNHKVNAETAAWLTACWTIPMVLWACYSLTGFGPVSLESYKSFRLFIIVALLVGSAAGIFVAWSFIGGDKNGKPWYTSGFLVSAVVFWAIAPPVWFFVEYYHFDSGTIQAPTDFIKCKSQVAAECVHEIRIEYLKHVKAYSDQASKIWAAVGTVLGGAIAAARR